MIVKLIAVLLLLTSFSAAAPTTESSNVLNDVLKALGSFAGALNRNEHIRSKFDKFENNGEKLSSLVDALQDVAGGNANSDKSHKIKNVFKIINSMADVNNTREVRFDRSKMNNMIRGLTQAYHGLNAATGNKFDHEDTINKLNKIVEGKEFGDMYSDAYKAYNANHNESGPVLTKSSSRTDDSGMPGWSIVLIVFGGIALIGVACLCLNKKR